MDTVRVLRILEYIGPRDHIENTLAHNAVKGTKEFGKSAIREAIIGDFPEILSDSSTTVADLAQRYMTLIDKDWVFHAPETYQPVTRWIKHLAEGNLSAAEAVIVELEAKVESSSEE